MDTIRNKGDFAPSAFSLRGYIGILGSLEEGYKVIGFWERMKGLISRSGFAPDFLSGNSTGKVATTIANFSFGKIKLHDFFDYYM